jgi:hypothetical protein
MKPHTRAQVARRGARQINCRRNSMQQQVNQDDGITAGGKAGGVALPERRQQEANNSRAAHHWASPKHCSAVTLAALRPRAHTVPLRGRLISYVICLNL